MHLRDYTACDATELRRLLAAGEVSAQEVSELAIAAVEAVEPQLNAVVSGPYDDAPYAADGELAAVPMAVKDTLPEAGRPLGFGSRLLDGFTPRRDATLAERFRLAGLAAVVRSATPEFAFNIDTAPVVHGPTLNPWRADRSPGGSSGGSAALVAARALPVAHANDGGGSIRIPAAFCGLVGLKPSRGRIPLGPAVGEAVGGFAHEFALTRTVRDAAALLDVLNGPAPGDRYYVSRPQRSYREALAEPSPGPLRVAVHRSSFSSVAVEPEVDRAVAAVAGALERLGHHVEEACPDVRWESLRACLEAVWSVDLAGLARTFARLSGRDVTPDHVEAASLACIRRGRQVSGLELEDAASVVNTTARRWGRFLDEHDLFLCPTAATMPPPAGVPDQDDERIDTAGAWLDQVFERSPFTPIANLTGQPSLSLPLGESSEGLPIGVMLTAQTLREDLLLQIASVLEQEMPWSDRRPAIVAAAPSDLPAR